MFEKWTTENMAQALKEAEDELEELQREEKKRLGNIAEILHLIEILKPEYDLRITTNLKKRS